MSETRIVLAGNNLAATLVLDLILETTISDRVLCIAPESGHDWQPSLREHAQKMGVACLTPDDVNDHWVLKNLAVFRPSLFLSVYYTQLFSPALLSAVDCPVLNFHPSLLPRHRGVAPLIWAIMEGDTETGLTLHHVDEGIDTGPIVVQHALEIERDDTGYTLHQRMASLVETTARDLLAWHRFVGQDFSATPQTGEGSYHSAKERVNWIDWTLPRERIRNIVRANCPPLHGAYTLLGRGDPLVLGRVEPMDNGEFGIPGTVDWPEASDFPLVYAADGALRIVTFLDGDELRPGSALTHRLRHGQVLA